MDDWGVDQLNTWIDQRVHLPVGPLFCILDGPTRGRAWAPTAVRGELRTSGSDGKTRPTRKTPVS